MRKVYILLLLIFAIFASACSTQVSEDNQSSNSNNSNSNNTENYQVGVVFPLSGNAAEHGIDMLNGLEYAVDEVNSSGGINGIPVELVVEDGKASPKDTVNASQKLITVDKVPAIFTGFSSPVLATAPIADQNKVVLINSAAATPALAEAGDYLINTLVLQSVELDYIAKYATEELGLKTMGIIYQNNDLGLGTKDALEIYMKNYGGEVVAAESFEVGALDFRTQLSKIRSAKPDALYLATAGKDSPLIIKQARELGITSQFFGYHALEMPPEYMEIAGDFANGTIYTSSATEYDVEFAKKWAEDHDGKEIVFTNAMYYDAAKMLFKGMEHVINNGDDLSGETLRSAIFEINTFDGIAGNMRIPDNGNAIKEVSIKQIKDGEFTTLKVIEP
ncbi:ABC transporter substrate-binding protein [Bacillus sp. Marseille-P3661]|uniref:ABC transporter substrate-binding protein n=1 Tax=Bacillus sp. Marseille-P3661 TaxID=1936234 RepID=UPI000C8495C1|nr:ABC transporter substrate-binding protein [Bacillus sp. Marseille-P3661]